MSVVMRHATEADLPFIFSSWLKSYRLSSAVRDMDAEAYFAQQHYLCEFLLGTSRTVVACSAAEPTEVLGWLVYEDHLRSCVVHWCYVKSAFRRLGIASQLVREALKTCSDTVRYTHKPKRTGGSAGLIKKFKGELNV